MGPRPWYIVAGAVLAVAMFLVLEAVAHAIGRHA